MKVLGLIVEYNPFHNGHLYHLEQSRELSSADCVVCVMSGNFIQRGEPAIINKWARTRMALLSGADLVLELPHVYAMSSAEYFAFGAVKILDSLGVVSHICFGSENGRITDLDKIAQVLYEEPEQYKQLLKSQLDRGLSYPASRETALKLYFSRNDDMDDDWNELMGSANNILGIEYLKALKRLGSSITPLTLKRINNSYNSEHMTGSISSATAIRRNIWDNLLRNESLKIEKALPQSSLSVLEEEFTNGRGPIFSRDFELPILTSIRKSSREFIKSLPNISEGLENRFKAAADNAGTFEELVDQIATKRYTRTRIQRTLLGFLTGLTSHEFDSFNQSGGPRYIRVLGFNKNGHKLLGEMKSSARLPVIIKTADFKASEDPLIRRMLEIEALATDLYVLAYKNPQFRRAGQEFTQNIIRL